MLQGDAKRAYQRVWMRRKRAGKPTVNPKPWKPTKRMVDQVRYWLRTGAPQSLTGRKIIEGLDPTDEHEALRRYKAHLDEHERERYAPPPPKCCSFCGEPASDERTLVGSTTYPLICETCTARAAGDLRGATQAAVTASILDQIPASDRPASDVKLSVDENCP